ncbi:unnamed protein product [Strongylus vulgaris]|uniref:Uncharacterized protein n=1 Tax=Strongylus vulgaris TaxID=40348 RepID=A0A3P7JCM3_STRVU|nr:unnamed protein product [Strongylus vulgaris]
MIRHLRSCHVQEYQQVQEARQSTLILKMGSPLTGFYTCLKLRNVRISRHDVNDTVEKRKPLYGPPASPQMQQTSDGPLSYHSKWSRRTGSPWLSSIRARLVEQRLRKLGCVRTLVNLDAAYFFRNTRQFRIALSSPLSYPSLSTHFYQCIFKLIETNLKADNDCEAEDEEKARAQLLREMNTQVASTMVAHITKKTSPEPQKSPSASSSASDTASSVASSLFGSSLPPLPPLSIAPAGLPAPKPVKIFAQPVTIKSEATEVEDDIHEPTDLSAKTSAFAALGQKKRAREICRLQNRHRLTEFGVESAEMWAFQSVGG